MNCCKMPPNLVSRYLVVKKSQSFDLKYKEVILVCAGGLLRLHRLD